jgi:hypothetical protein
LADRNSAGAERAQDSGTRRLVKGCTPNCPRRLITDLLIDFKKIIDGRVRVYLAAAGIKTIKLNNVARLYLDLRRQVAVPTVMS